MLGHRAGKTGSDAVALPNQHSRATSTSTPATRCEMPDAPRRSNAKFDDCRAISVRPAQNLRMKILPPNWGMVCAGSRPSSVLDR